MKRKPMLLDIMQGDKFICQLKYTKRGIPAIVDGEIREVYNMDDLEQFVYENRPSLRGGGIKIAFSNNRVLSN